MAANTMARNGVGRLWTLLTGERGEYEIAAGDLASARKRLDTMAGFANDGLMIPEQVWDLKKRARFVLVRARVRRRHWRGPWRNSFGSRSILRREETWRHRGLCGSGMLALAQRRKGVKNR